MLFATIPLTLLLAIIMVMLWPRKQKTLKEIAIESAQIFAIVGGLAILTYVEHSSPAFGNMPDELYRLCFKATLMMLFLGIVRIGLMLIAYVTCDSKSKQQRE